MLITLDRRGTAATAKQTPVTITFTRYELNIIAALYATYVAKGLWRDYALDFTKTMAAFSMYRHAHEQPLVAVLKTPANTKTDYLFEVIVDRQSLIRTPFLDRAMTALRDNLGDAF